MNSISDSNNQRAHEELIQSLYQQIGEMLKEIVLLTLRQDVDLYGEIVSKGNGKNVIDFIFELAKEKAYQKAFMELSADEEWEELLCLQIEKLKLIGYDEIMHDRIDRPSLFYKEIKKRKIEYSSTRLPFLLIIPKEQAAIYQQIEKIRYKGRLAELNVNVGDIDSLSFSRHPYLIMDVEIDPSLANMSDQEARNRIAELGRSPLIIEESIALLTHIPECLNAGSLVLDGSKAYKSSLMWKIVGIPNLNTVSDEWTAKDRRILLSCKDRIIIR